ncbi:MAG TPA: GAF domain-containing sensor histidine kinase [Candidatus Limnocylindria bacterium]|nr:GAF domain-containing sensor histidine kinase [Candidatus Limnocylindria bacterium]
MHGAAEAVDKSLRERDALDAAVQGIAGVLDLDRVLQLIVDRVRELADGEYAALGIIGPDESLERFITSGIDAAERNRIGALPTGRGLLGVIIRESQSLRLADLATDERRSGFPAHHPPMHSFLGVPVRIRDRAIGNFYLTNKRGAAEFSLDDQRLVERFALPAAIAIDTARLHGEVQRLAIMADRDRIGRDLHDGVIQRLYAVTLSLDDVPELMDEAPGEARERVERSIQALQSAIGDIRAFIYDLRPVEVSATDLHGALVELAEEAEMNGATEVQVQIDGDAPIPSAQAIEMLAIAREALSNVGRHAAARHATIHLAISGDAARLTITDDGRGFDVEAPRDGGHRGLGNMRDRAGALGGRLTVTSVAGEGTRVVAEIPGQSSDPVA